MENFKRTKKSPMMQLLQWADKDRKWIILSTILGFLGGLLAIGLYIGIYNIMDALVLGTCSKKVIIDNALLITITVIVRNSLVGASGVFSHKGAYGALFNVRCMVTNHLSHVPLGALNDKRTGDIKTVINEDIEKLERGLAHNLPEFVSYFTGPVVIFFYLLFVNCKLALISLLPLVLVAIIMVFIFVNMSKVMGRANDASKIFNSVIIEYIEGMRLIKAYNLGSKSFKKYSDAINEENSVWNEMAKKTGPLYASFLIALECGIVILVPVGARLLFSEQITASVFLLFAYIGSLYLSELIPLQQLSMELAQVLQGITKVNDILSIPVFSGGKDFPDQTEIRIENVDFSYPNSNEAVLKNVSMNINQGQKIAIVGKSGAGKSTIIQLVSRFYDVDCGRITIGGVDVKDIDYKELLDNISIVFQKSFLTSDTIYENIAMGRETSLEAVRDAAKKAQIDDFIMSLPLQYDTQIGGISSKLSGGEKQRIAIARAILKDSPILILDEATSAADPENQAMIDLAIDNLCRGKTVIIVAHRLDIVELCDKVAVVENNTISAFGTHEEVISTCEYYRQAHSVYKEARNVEYKLA